MTAGSPSTTSFGSVNPLLEALRSDLGGADLPAALELAASLRAKRLPSVDRHIQSLAAEVLAPRFFEAVREAMARSRLIEVAQLISDAPAALLPVLTREEGLRAAVDRLCALALSPGLCAEDVRREQFVCTHDLRRVSTVLHAVVPGKLRDYRAELPASVQAARELIGKIVAARDSGQISDGAVSGISHGLQDPQSGMPPMWLLELIEDRELTELALSCIPRLVTTMAFPDQQGRLASGDTLSNDRASRTMVLNLEYVTERAADCIAELRGVVSIPLGIAIGTLLRNPDEFPRPMSSVDLLQAAERVLFPPLSQGSPAHAQFVIGLLYGAAVLAEMPEQKALQGENLHATWRRVCATIESLRPFSATAVLPNGLAREAVDELRRLQDLMRDS